MSSTQSGNLNGTDGHPQRQTQDFSDSSGPVFSLYSKIAVEEDDKMAERWKTNADGILIFSGLFSAAVATLLGVTIPDLKSSPQAVSASHLEKILQILANPNASHTVTPTLTTQSAFSPQNYIVWVNLLWFLSLTLSLMCALLATSLQQWARRYIRITQPPRLCPHARARIRAFFSDGIDKSHLTNPVEVLPLLLHLSLFLFFAGLLIYLFNINLTVAIAVICCVGLFTVVYACATLMPFLRHNSPYYTPLSLSAWFFYTGLSYVCDGVNVHDHGWLWDMKRMADKIASELPQGIESIDGRILKWTIDALDDDHEWEQFFAGIPGFFRSKLINNPGILVELRSKFGGALSGFLDRTLTSNLVSEPIKTRRLMTCFNAADATSTSIDQEFVRGVVSGRWGGVLQSVEIGNYLKSRGNRDQETSLYSQAIVAGVIANVQEHDHRWSALAKDQLGISRDVFQDYVAHGDSVLLANLIHITSKIRTVEGDHYSAYISSTILRSVSQFDILRALPKLQHDFCALWNDVVQEALKSGPDSIPIYILRYIRHLYIALHQGTDASPTLFSSSTADKDDVLCHGSSYPLCNIADHRPVISGVTTHWQFPVATSSTVFYREGHDLMTNLR